MTKPKAPPPPQAGPVTPAQAPQPEKPKEKKGFFRRILGVFK